MIRSLWSSLAVGIGEAFYGPGSAASQGGSTSSTGEPRPGNLRFAVGGSSIITGGYNNGFLGLNTHRLSLHHIGVTSTILGHSGMLDMNGLSGDTAPYNSWWVLQTQTGNTGVLLNSGQVIEITYPSAYSGRPFVWIGASSTSLVVGSNDTDISAATFSSRWSFIGGSGASKTDNVVYYVLSLGTQSL